MIHKTKEYRRMQRENHIARKVRKLRSVGNHVGCLGMLDKGKIHCSCPLCAFSGSTEQDRRNLMRMFDAVDDLADVSSSVTSTVKNKLRKSMDAHAGRPYGNSEMETRFSKGTFDPDEFRILISA